MSEGRQNLLWRMLQNITAEGFFKIDSHFIFYLYEITNNKDVNYLQFSEPI